KSFSLILSSVFSMLLAPLADKTCKLSFDLRKSEICSDKAVALAVAVAFSSKQEFNFTVAELSKSWVSFCFACKSVNCFLDTQELNSNVIDKLSNKTFFIIIIGLISNSINNKSI